jgi:hypothetical protein
MNENGSNSPQNGAEPNRSREHQVELVKGIAGDLANPLRTRKLAFSDFFSRLIGAVVLWFIGCCVVALVNWIIFGSSVAIAALGYVVVALVVLWFTFTEKRKIDPI